MSSPGPEAIGAKRKRSPVDDAVTRPPPNVHAGISPTPVTQINYLMKAKNERLRLIEGDMDTFGDVLGMIDDYEGEFLGLLVMGFTLGSRFYVTSQNNFQGCSNLYRRTSTT